MERSSLTIDALDVRQLRAVEAVDRHRHFSRAAEELHVAQSAPSHQIR
jgi:DNA-binding transcriptional LysR family regulator